MAHRVCVRLTGEDARAQVRLEKIRRLFPELEATGLHLVDNYTISKDLPPRELERVRAMLTHPAIEESSAGEPLLPGCFTWSFEIGFLPGVTDNVGHTAREAIGDLLGATFEEGEDVYFSQTTFLAGELREVDVVRIASSRVYSRAGSGTLAAILSRHASSATPSMTNPQSSGLSR